MSKKQLKLSCRGTMNTPLLYQKQEITIKSKSIQMKTSLQKISKRLLTLGLAFAAYTGANAQCAATTAVTPNSANDITTNTSMTFPAGWNAYVSVYFGDGNSSNSFLGTATSYSLSHSYAVNGIYSIYTSVHAFNPADSSFFCDVTDVDTFVVNMPCSVDLSAINYNQNSGYNFDFSTTVTSTNYVDLYWSVTDSAGGLMYSQTGGTNLNYTFPNSGTYNVLCFANAYDSLTMTSCFDSAYVWIPLDTMGGNPGGCNLQAYVNVTPTTGLNVIVNGYANNNYQYSYLLIDNQYYYNQDSVNYTFPAAGSYNVCFYAQDTTAATYCYDSICMIYNTNGTPNPIQCNAYFYVYQDSLNPTVWHGYNASTGSAYMTYLWDFGDGSTSTLPYPTHTYATPGNYVICLTVVDTSTMCTSTHCDSSAAFRLSTAALMGSISIASPTGIKDNSHIVSGAKVFPNPMADFSAIAFSSTTATNGKIEVVGVLGNTVLSENVSIAKGSNEIKLNTATLTNGVYYIKVVSGTEVLSTIKAVK
jgi:PKD repeat protein